MTDESRTGGWVNILETAQDWNIISVPQKHANNRPISLSRGRFLGGSSGINGTLCIRGTEQDFDDWGLDG
jgi:choline dehydrogenase-like flavoprotein